MNCSPSDDLFDISPKRHRLNILPPNPEGEIAGRAVDSGRFPSWLHRPLPKGNRLLKTSQLIAANRLHTVCEEAKCPNLLECYSQKTATFLILGKQCTRSCSFCDIDFSKQPPPPDPEEGLRVAQSAQALGLKHVVITMVARDDLADGGAAHLLSIVQALRTSCPSSTIELLTSDLQGNWQAFDQIGTAAVEIFNHNIETVARLSNQVRHRATYSRSLQVLQYMKEKSRQTSLEGSSPTLIKSGLMVGLGESEAEVLATLDDLKAAGVDIVTIGQYLQPNHHKRRVKAFISPAVFKKYSDYGAAIGIRHMYCGPFVRSSYNANLVFNKANQTLQIDSL